MSISVIMPTARDDYSIIGQPDLHYLEPTIKSLSKQTFKDFEFIIVDSLYERRNLIHDFSKLPFPVTHVPVHPNHRFWLDNKRWAVCGALNTALIHAEGELIVRIDDCSEFDPEYLERIWEEYQSDGWLFGMHTRYRGGQQAYYNNEYREQGYDFAREEPNRKKILGRVYEEGDPIRDTRFNIVKRAGGRMIAPYEWMYGYSTFTLEAALKVNGYDERFDGDKSIEDMDFGSRLDMAGYKGKFVLDVKHQVIEHEHMPIPEELIARDLKPIKCNYALFNLNRIDKSWKANCVGLNEKQLDYIRQVSLDQPCSPTPNFYMGDCSGELWDLWASNPPVFNLREERLDLEDEEVVVCVSVPVKTDDKQLQSKKFRDMVDYVEMMIGDDSIESVIDFGTGPKGVVGQHYWENVNKISRGYACDIWKIKKLPPVWTPLVMNAFDIFDVLEPKSVDVVQAFGFMEHLTKEDGYRFLKIAETLARKYVIVSAANCLHGLDGGNIPGYDPDYKCKMDGNEYHRYNSIWHWREFEALGYESNLKDAKEGITFRLESIAWKVL